MEMTRGASTRGCAVTMGIAVVSRVATWWLSVVVTTWRLCDDFGLNTRKEPMEL